LVRILVLTTLLFTMSSCSAFGPVSMDRTNGMLGGYGSPDFKVGFNAGCQSGFSNAGNPYNPYNKNRELYEEGGDYKDGWDEGYQRCYSRYDALNKSW